MSIIGILATFYLTSGWLTNSSPLGAGDKLTMQSLLGRILQLLVKLVFARLLFLQVEPLRTWHAFGCN